MKEQILAFLLFIAFVAPLAAQKPDAADQNLRKHVAYLAAPTLEGRRTGEQGATVAAGYVANLFAQYKLKAGVERVAAGKTSRNYLQNFPYVTGVELAATGNEFKLNLRNADRRQVQLENAPSVKTLLFSPNGEAADAPIVFAGFGIESAAPRFNDYEGLDVRGRVVLAFDGHPEADQPRSAFARFDARAKAKIAKDKGAAALLLVTREENPGDDRLARALYDQTLGEAALPVFLVSRAAAANILGLPPAELKTIETLTAMKKDTTAGVKINFRDVGPSLTFKTNLVKKQTDAYNVVGVLEGTDPVLKSEAIVIGAHYDHLGRGGRGSLAAGSTEIHHGADDNASGTAALLELARQFAKEKKNRRTLVFVAFGGEEEGLLGSKHYVDNPVFPLAKTVAMINLDMVGRLNENKLTVGGIGTAAEWKALVEGKNSTVAASLQPSMAGNGGPVSASVFNLQLNEDGFGPSDHSSFYAKQIPVLFFFTGTHADYHKPSDTAEKINYQGLLNITNYVREIARAIDRNPQRPTYKVAQSAGQGGRMSFNVTIGVVPGYAESTDGLVLDGVRDGSPAALAGIKAGDKIVRLAGRDIRNISDYTFVLGELKADTEYEIEVVRGTERLKLKVKPAARR